MSVKNSDKPSRAGKKWTEEDNYELLDLLSSEHTIEDIAIKLGRTVGAIKTHLLKVIYELLNQGDWTAEELSIKYKLPVLEISNYQEREDKKKMNPPQKRVTRSDVIKKLDEKSDEHNQNNSKRSFSTVTKTREVLSPVKNKIPETKNSDVQYFAVLPQTYEEKSLALLTEIRDSLKIIAAKK